MTAPTGPREGAANSGRPDPRYFPRWPDPPFPPSPAARRGRGASAPPCATSCAPRRAAPSSVAAVVVALVWANAVAGLLRVVLAHRPVDPGRRPWDRHRAVRVNQGPDPVLPRGRPGKRDWTRGAARAQPHRDPRDGGSRRDARGRRPLPPHQPGWGRGERMGGGDVDRHRPGARDPRPHRAEGRHPPARLPPDDGRGRRRRRAPRHRLRLHRQRGHDRAAGGGRAVRRARPAALRPRGAVPPPRWWASRSGWRCTSPASTP